MLLTVSGRGFMKIQYSSFPLFPVAYPFHSNVLQYYVKCKKFKVNDVIFPSGCEACIINLGNKKIGIFTGATSARSKNIFINISRYPTRKHEIIGGNPHCFPIKQSLDSSKQKKFADYNFELINMVETSPTG